VRQAGRRDGRSSDPVAAGLGEPDVAVGPRDKVGIARSDERYCTASLAIGEPDEIQECRRDLERLRRARRPGRIGEPGDVPLLQAAVGGENPDASRPLREENRPEAKTSTAAFARIGLRRVLFV
ncbi:MAG: hypothetical protein LC780_06850, partial [Acidobacteria bacterium]|nr:hypothetical protein [Acidobacteriota bacterium]